MVFLNSLIVLFGNLFGLFLFFTVLDFFAILVLTDIYKANQSDHVNLILVACSVSLVCLIILDLVSAISLIAVTNGLVGGAA